MPRGRRNCPAGFVFHAINRSVARLTLFEKPGDYDAFERVLSEAWERTPIRILDYTVMPNHWHFVLWPQSDAEVTEFLRWLANTHTMRWHAHHGTGGTGHLYQGRFKSFPVQEDEHLYTVLRYVERNPVRAGFVTEAEAWRWGSAWRRRYGKPADREMLADWPIPRPRGWSELVNRAETDEELAAVRSSVNRSTPFGSEHWTTNTAARLGLEFSLRPRGRPRTERG